MHAAVGLCLLIYYFSRCINMCRFFSLKRLFCLSVLSICTSAHAAVPACNPNVEYTQVSGPKANYVYVNVKNNGSSTITAQVLTYKKYSSTDLDTTANDNSGVLTLLPGESSFDPIKTSYPECASVVVLQINGSSCSVEIQSFSGSGYCTKCGACSVPTPAPTCTPTATVTPTPTSTPTPTPQPPSCDAGGPYTGSSVACSTTPIAVQLNGSKSTGTGLSYAWTSNCPKGTFDNASLVSPKLSLVTAPVSATDPAVSCTINLKVSSSNGTSSTCSANLAAQTCVRDCAGVINGPSVADRCGVCNGDGQSCVGCNSVNINGNQLAIDSNANSLRDNVLKVNKQLQIASKNAKLSSKELKSVNNLIASSNAKADSTYKEVWTMTYTSFPQTILTCVASFCVNVSTASNKTSIDSGNDELLALAKTSDAKLKSIEKAAKRNKVSTLSKVTSASRKSSSIVKESTNLNTSSANELAKIPANQSSCN